MLGVAVVFLALASVALSEPADEGPRWMLTGDVGIKILDAGRQQTLTIDRLDGELLRLHGPKLQAAPPAPG